ncbi:MAG: type IV secretory system conjugative DNA transfer family protein [Methyloligellaceae bacterium]
MPVMNAPDLDQGTEALFLLMILLLGLVGLALLGPTGVVFFLMTLGGNQGLGLQRIGSVGFGALGLTLAVIFGRGFDDPYWQDRIDIAWAVVLDDRGTALWFADLNICVEAISGGLLLAALCLGAFEIWKLSPFRRLATQRETIRQKNRTTRWARFCLNRVNGGPASKATMTVLGVDKKTGATVSVPDQSLNTHMLILGTTGSGKTVSLLNFVESFADRGLPIIFIDGKGDLALAETVMAYAAFKKRPHWRLSMVGPSCVYNPFVGDYTSLKDKVIALRLNWSEEHYLKLAEGYLQMVFKVLQAIRHPVNLLSVARQFDIDVLMQTLRQAEAQGGISTVQAKDLMGEIEGQQDAAKHVESLKAELSNLAHSSLRHLFDVTSARPMDQVLSLKTVLQQKGVAYMALTPLIYPEVAGVMGRLILNDLKASLNPGNPQKVLLIIDEISTLVSTQFLNFLNQGRYVGLHIILTAQSVADLGQKISGNANLFIRQILSNCNVFVVHKINDHEDAELMASVLGTSPEIDYTAQVAEFGAETGLGSAHLVHEFLAHPDEIKSLSRGEALLLDKNRANTLTTFLGRKGLLVD